MRTRIARVVPPHLSGGRQAAFEPVAGLQEQRREPRCKLVLSSIHRMSFYGHECAVLFHSAVSSGFASAGPKSDLELIPLGFAPENHIPTASNDSESAEEVLK